MIRLVVDISLSPVVQVRAHDVLPDHLEDVVVTAIRTYESQLQQGAIVTVDESRGKVRTLPIGVTQRDSARSSGN